VSGGVEHVNWRADHLAKSELPVSPYSVSCSRERQLAVARASAASHLDWSDRICMQIAIKTHAARNYTMDLLIAKAYLALSHLLAEL
jgi:hypothetical protein